MNKPGLKKRRWQDLAIFGGEPLFPKPLVVGQPNIPDVDAFLQDVRKVLASGSLTNNGPYVRAFEDRIRQISQTEYCVATCNATAALELTAKALGLTGEVIVPSFTFIATAHALSWQGLTPVFADVDPVSHTLDPSSVERAITSETSAICGVHLWGNVCDVDALQHIADRHRLALWFDASHAFSVARDGVSVGNFGVAEVFSFHATKFVNAFEGGAIVTNDGNLARDLREMRNFGFAEGRDREVARLGINAKMPEVSAAMGIRALDDVERIREANRRNARRYREVLAECSGIRLSAPTSPGTSNCQYVVAEIDVEQTGLSRDQLLHALHAEGVVAKSYFAPGCHRAAPYERRSGDVMELPVTERLAETVLVLPTGLKASEKSIERIGGLIAFLIDVADDVRGRLGVSG